MSKARKSLVVPALAAASLVFGSVLAAPAVAQGDRNNSNDASLVNISDNNVGPIQICHNNIPLNGVGVQVPLQDLIASLGIGGAANGNVTKISKDCIQVSEQPPQKPPEKPPEEPPEKPPEEPPEEPPETPPEEEPPEEEPPEEKPPEDQPEEEPEAPEDVTLPTRIDAGR